MKKFVLAVIVLAYCSLCFAENPGMAKSQTEDAAKLVKQTAMEAVVLSPLATTTCAFTFTSGTNFTSVKFCVTSNGNIVEFEAPAGFPLISQHFGEGYGICDKATGVEYHDYGGAGDSGNWGPATVVSHDAKSVKIARTTSDGLWTLTQTIDLAPASAKIAMALKNNSSTSRQATVLRYVDVDADGQLLNNLDGTTNDAFGWNPVRLNTGLLIGLDVQNLGTTLLSSAGFAQGKFAPPPACDPFKNFVQGIVTETDGSLGMVYEPIIAPGKTVTVTLAYKGM